MQAFQASWVFSRSSVPSPGGNTPILAFAPPPSTSSAPTKVTLRLLAREDTEARVRRAAVTRLSDAVLGDIGMPDPDEDVRAEAIRGLAGLAAEADDLDRAADAVRQLVALGRVKEVVVAARENPDARVRASWWSISWTTRNRWGQSAVMRPTARRGCALWRACTTPRDCERRGEVRAHGCGGVGPRSR